MKWILTIAFVSLIGCKERTFHEGAQTQEVVNASLKPVSDANFTFQLDKARQAGIPHSASKFIFQPPTANAVTTRDPATGKTREAPTGGGLNENSNFHVSISFSKISKVQCETLMKLYRGTEKVPCVDGGSYQLTDFLPAKIQALVGKHFAIQREQLSEAEIPQINKWGREVSNVSNCFQAAWEATRGGTDDISFFFPESRQFEKFVLSDKYSTPVKELSLEQMKPDGDSVGRNQGLKTGDMIVVYAPTWDARIKSWGKPTLVGHSAIFIDKDLYFEKTAGDASYLYRLVTYKEMLFAGSYQVDGDFSKTRIIYRRFDKARLPTASEAFSIASDNGFKFFEHIKGQTANIDPNMKKQLNITDQPGAGGGSNFVFYRIMNMPLALDEKSSRYRMQNKAFTPEAFWIHQ